MKLGSGICKAAIAPVTGIIVQNLCTECAPFRWDEQGRHIIYEYAKANPVCKLWGENNGLIGRPVEAGDVNCRYTGMISIETPEDRCVALAKKGFGTPPSKVLLLNPSLENDCSKIKYNTPYCVEGCK